MKNKGKLVAGGCFELYSKYTLQIQAVAASTGSQGVRDP
jgi:hypothetical protein